MIYKVMMLGTDVKTQGGISSVIKNYIDYGITERLGISYYATHKDGSKINKMLFFVSQFMVIFCKMPLYKIIHFQSSQGWSYRRLFTLFIVAKLFGKKTIWHIHGSQFDLYYKDTNFFEKNIINYGLRKADKVIALSEAWKEKLKTIEPDASIDVILNGVNVKKYQVFDRQYHDPMTVLFLGRLGERKGIYDILDTIEILSDKGIHFILAGDGEINKVKGIIKKKGLESIVEIPGWIGDSEKSALLLKSDIYILPSYNEGLPMSILEAMASGLPIVSTPVGGIPDAVISDKNGYLVSPGDVSNLAEKILILNKNKKLWRKMSVESSKIAEDIYDMSRIELELTQLYKKLN